MFPGMNKINEIIKSDYFLTELNRKAKSIPENLDKGMFSKLDNILTELVDVLKTFSYLSL